NDSKGTNADAAAHALSSFADIFWIAGGKPKLGGITSLTEFFPRIRKAYLIGEAAAEFAETLGDHVPHEISETLDVAVDHAATDAEASPLADPVVLLSPACASFDQYRNFEIRGARFRELVQALPGVKPAVCRNLVPHSPLSSHGLTGRPSIPETVLEPRGRGVLDAPVKAGA